MCSFLEKELEQAGNLPLPVVPGAHRDLTLLLLPLILSTSKYNSLEKELEQAGNLPLSVVPGTHRDLTLLFLPLILSTHQYYCLKKELEQAANRSSPLPCAASPHPEPELANYRYHVVGRNA